jgi:hypothetical protein
MTQNMKLKIRDCGLAILTIVFKGDCGIIAALKIPNFKEN